MFIKTKIKIHQAAQGNKMKKLLQIIAILLVLNFLSTQAVFANLMPVDGVVYDSETNYEWILLSDTLNRSIQQAIDEQGTDH